MTLYKDEGEDDFDFELDGEYRIKLQTGVHGFTT